MRTIDKSKKANIKCEYCGNYQTVVGRCLVTGEDKNYWQRCKQFVWREDKKYTT